MRQLIRRWLQVDEEIDRKLNIMLANQARLEKLIMAQASDFVAVAATLSQEVSDLSAAVGAAVAEIQALVNAAPATGIDPATLDAPLASLTQAATALAAADAALKAAPPAPTPAPAPTPPAAG